MKITGLRLCIATSKLIRQWAQRQLPNGKIIRGEILNPKTVNYQTLKPERDGLFCERIFGPINDSLCACGRPPLRGQKFCSRCEVEYISTRVRRYRLGYIQLITAGAHIWFLKGNYFSLFFNLPKKKIECLIYCTQNISRTIFEFWNLSFSLNCSFEKHFTLQKLAFGEPGLEVPIPEVLHPFGWSGRSSFRGDPSRLVQPSFGWTSKSKRAILNFDPPFANPETEKCRSQKIYQKVKIKVLEQSPSASFKGRATLILKEAREARKKSLWQNGGLRDSALYFGISLISKMSSWFVSSHWFCFLNFISSSPPKGDILKKWYPGPPGLVNFWGFHSRLFCFTGIQLMRTWLTQLTQNKCYDGRLLEIQIRLDLLQLEHALSAADVSQAESEVPFSFPLSPSPVRRSFPPKGGSAALSGSFEGGRRGYLRGEQSQSRRPTGGAGGRPMVRGKRGEQPVSARDRDSEFVHKVQLFRRLKYLRSFRYTQINPASMILSVLPVLPPDLRPILELENNQIAISDFNKLYQTILFRNRRLSRLTRDPNLNFHCLNSEALQYGQRLLQESIDDLIENGDKSLSDLFKGKKGRFRQNLLGKRVDYSGRSVIVVGPQLKLYECGLPKKIAYELFQPFILRILLKRSLAKTVLGAKKLYKKLPSAVIWNLVQGSLREHPILLNRAPSLHRLSIQAFKPRLINGKAVLLHPLVCSAFNADFDGDQMGIHLPLCFEARAEAWKIAWSQNNLFSVATSSPVCSPSQDMILGSSFLTIGNTFNSAALTLLAHSPGVPEVFPPEGGKQSPLKLKGVRSALGSLSAKGRESDAFLSLKRGRGCSRPFSLSPPADHNHRPTSGPSGASKDPEGIKRGCSKPIWVTYNSNFYGFETDHKKQKLIELRVNINGYFQKYRSQFYQQYHSSSAKLLRKMRTTYGRMKFYQSI